MRQTLIVDASFNHDTGATGIGIVIHQTSKMTGNRNGEIIDEISESFLDIRSGHGEMLALFRAMQISKARGFKTIKLLSDFNAMRTALKESYREQAGYDRVGLFGEVMRLSREFYLVKFGYKERRKNQMAHKLARIGAKDIEPVRDEFLIEVCSASSPKLKAD